MSTVVGSYGTQTPSFNYPNTAMSAWLCGAVVSGVYNNSAAEGQLFYEKFTGQSQAGNSLTVNGVTCPTREDVENGSVTNINGTYYPPLDGYQALIDDMTTGTGSCSAMGAIRQGGN